MRIVSLLPSATEIICGLGLRDNLVGVTHECDYPSDVTDLPKVTKTLIPMDATSNEIDQLVRERLKTERALYSLDIPILQQLSPDLIVTQALCDVCAVAESEVRSAVCSLPGAPRVINLEPKSLEDVFGCIAQVAEAAGCQQDANAYLARLKQRVEAVTIRSDALEYRPRVMLLEWIDPPFCAGHWNPELVAIAGGQEVMGVPNQPSATTSWEQIVAVDPEILVIACCGFDVNRTLQDLLLLESNRHWHSLTCVKSKQVYIVDGSAYFSRPGPRLVDSLEILANAIHPRTHRLPAGLLPASHWGDIRRSSKDTFFK